MFFTNDEFIGNDAVWNYPNGGPGVLLMFVGFLVWSSALILLIAVSWKGTPLTRSETPPVPMYRFPPPPPPDQFPPPIPPPPPP